MSVASRYEVLDLRLKDFLALEDLDGVLVPNPWQIGVFFVSRPTSFYIKNINRNIYQDVIP